MKRKSIGWLVLLGANVVIWCVLSFYQSSSAAQQRGQQPFANSVEQRSAMIRELQEIKLLLKEQNKLLKAAQPKPTNGKSTR